MLRDPALRGASDAVVESALPASGAVTPPGDSSEAHPVADTLAPLAHAATASPVVPSAAAQAARKRL
jgi:hypothetical protein